MKEQTATDRSDKQTGLRKNTVSLIGDGSEPKASNRFPKAITALVRDIQSLQAALEVGIELIESKLDETRKNLRNL